MSRRREARVSPLSINSTNHFHSTKWVVSKESLDDGCPQSSIPDVFRALLRTIHISGIPCFINKEENKRRYWITILCRVINILFSFSILFCVLCRLRLGLYEDTGILLFFILHIWVGLFHVYRNRERIEKILRVVFKHVSEKEKTFMSKLDKLYFRVPTIVTAICIPSYIAYIIIRLNQKPNFLDYPLFTDNDTLPNALKVVRNTSVTLIYIVGTFGNATNVIRFYLVVCLFFEGYAMNLKDRLEDLLSGSGNITAESVRDIRSRLRLYYTQKVKAEKHVTLLPFLWLSYLMVTATSYFTKAATDWKQEQDTSEAFFVVNTFLSVVYFASTSLASIVTERGDNKFSDCIQKALALSDPRRNDFPSNQMPVDVRKEILLLHHEMTNRPVTASKVLGMVTFDRGMLLSFIGHLINFAVMVINIRVAFKTGSFVSPPNNITSPGNSSV